MKAMQCPWGWERNLEAVRLEAVELEAGDGVVGYIDLVTEQAYHYHGGAPADPVPLPEELRDAEQAARAELLEVLADFDDRLLEELLEDMEALPPVYGLAIAPENRKDEVKLSAALNKTLAEDPALGWEQQGDTHEVILWGQGEINLQINLDRLRRKYNLSLTTHTPHIAYQESWAGSGTQGQTQAGAIAGVWSRFRTYFRSHWQQRTGEGLRSEGRRSVPP